jgi:predicted SprT family Zn-dependent metalloprotease
VTEKLRPLRSIVADLRKHFPAIGDVVVERRPMANPAIQWGQAYVGERNGKQVLVIVINNALTKPQLEEAFAYMVLAHEWAHCAAWRPEHQEERRLLDHDAEWGVIAAAIWAHLAGDADTEQ